MEQAAHQTQAQAWAVIVHGAQLYFYYFTEWWMQTGFHRSHHPEQSDAMKENTIKENQTKPNKETSWKPWWRQMWVDGPVG